MSESIPQLHFAVGKQAQCSHCGHGIFQGRPIPLSTRGATFCNFDRPDKDATVRTRV